MKPWKRWVASATLAPLVMTGLQPAHADTPTDSCSSFTVDVTGMENARSGATLLTQFPSELVSAASYGFEPTADLAFKASSGPGVAVWRMYNSRTNDFTWAADGADVQSMLNDGYAKQFKQFSASATNSSCLSSAVRLVKGDKTRVMVGDVARDAALADGWELSASEIFYAVSALPDKDAAGEPGEDGPAVTPDAKSFTVAVMPDTQQETWSDADSRFKNRSEWLVANAAEQNLKFVTHVGDVVDWGNVAPKQYTRVRDGLSPLDGKIPYSLTVGNHDTAAVCQGGSACPGQSASIGVRDTAAFNAALGGSRYANLGGQFEAGKVDNSFSVFEGGGQDWMVLNLELWPRQAAIDWAKKVVASHPKHNVIVATHSYLDSDGSIGRSSGGYGATSPMHLFDSLIKVYPNVVMVMSGHTGGGASRVDTGVNGNKILSLLQCYHSRTTNPVRLLTISPSAGTVTHRVYAPYTDETLAEQVTVDGFKFER